jgi:hypothetical protein
MGAVYEVCGAPSPQLSRDTQFRLHVIYTTPATTKASLGVASLLAQDLGAALELLVARVVPYPLPLNCPTTPARFNEEVLGSFVNECGVDAFVKVLLCRDREETIPQWIPAESIVVIGRRRRWGPESSWRLIRMLKHRGHHVIVVDAKERLLAPTAVCGRRGSY